MSIRTAVASKCNYIFNLCAAWEVEEYANTF